MVYNFDMLMIMIIITNLPGELIENMVIDHFHKTQSAKANAAEKICIVIR